MNRDTMHYTARLAAMDIIEWTHCDNQHECPDYPTERIVSLLEGMQREIEQANEDGELLAYNCEKRVKQEVIDKACNEFSHFLDYLRDAGKITLQEREDSEWYDKFREELSGINK